MKFIQKKDRRLISQNVTAAILVTRATIQRISKGSLSVVTYMLYQAMRSAVRLLKKNKRIWYRS